MRHEIADSYPLSPMQQGMLFHTLYAPHSGVDMVQIVGVLQEEMHRTTFERVWQEVIARHAILRTAFRWEGLDTPRQEVQHAAHLAINWRDWRSLQPNQQEERLAAYLRNDLRQGFDFTRPPLMRLTLFQVAQGEYCLVWTFHHILLDGASILLVLREAFNRYDAQVQGQTLHLPAPRPYRDYITWLQQQDFSRSRPFWQQMLQGVTAPTRLFPEKTADTPAATRSYGDQQHQLSPQTTAALKRLAKQHSLSITSVIQAAWALLLHRYTGEQAVIFGAIREGRQTALGGKDTGTMVGPLINAVPVCVRMSPEMSGLALLRTVYEQWHAIRPHEHTPLVQIQEWSEAARGVSLLDSLLIFDRATLNDAVWAEGGPWLQREFQVFNRTNYPLTWTIYGGEALTLRASYDRQRFDDDSISRVIGHLQSLLEGMAAAPQRPVSRMPLLTQAERQQMLVDWNATSADYPRAFCLHHLFEQQAQRTPDAVAVVFADRHLTYRELSEQSDHVAGLLRALDCGPETLVGVALEPALEMLPGLLGVLKAGAAYVPLDPAYPRERLAFMLEDAQIPVLLTLTHLAERLPAHNATVIYLDETLQHSSVAASEHSSVEAPEQSGAPTPESLAYVIYTSGSTGKPKGVEIPHRALVNFLTSMQRQPGLSEGDTLLSVTTLSFDISALELFLPLITGARTVLVSRETAADGALLAEQIAQSGATVMQATPATWRLLVQSGWQGRQGLKMLCGGEALPRDLASMLLERGASLWNMYGPTETTIWSTICRIEHADAITIGRPIANTTLAIVDAAGQPVPVGVAGELLIGGAGLARGYRNRPALTAEKFVPDPFSSQPDALLYRTGDLARYRPDGLVEFIGRSDYQVKIRGFRIEPGEIEATLNAHPAVRQSVVIDSDDPAGSRRLVAYVVPQDNGEWGMEHGEWKTGSQSSILNSQFSILNSQELRRYLRDRLPDYMVPSIFMALDELPLTPNGKIDRRALPAPDTTRQDQQAAYVAPRSPVEETLARIWAEVLQVERVGVHDNFFALGGHSLLATRIVARLHQELAVALPLRSLFEALTVAALADYIETIHWFVQQRSASDGRSDAPAEHREEGEI